MAHPRWAQLVNSIVWIETEVPPTPNSQAFPLAPQCFLRSGESQAALRQRCRPGAEGRPIPDVFPFAVRWPGAPGSGRLALHLSQSLGRPSSVLSALLEPAGGEELASAEVSPLLPASSETMLGTQVGARRLRSGLFRTQPLNY